MSKDERLEQLHVLMNRNNDLLRELDSMKAALDPLSILNLRLDTIIDVLMPDDKDRITYEIKFHEEMHKVLVQCRRKVKRQVFLDNLEGEQYGKARTQRPVPRHPEGTG